MVSVRLRKGLLLKQESRQEDQSASQRKGRAVRLFRLLVVFFTGKPGSLAGLAKSWPLRSSLRLSAANDFCLGLPAAVRETAQIG